jgi:RNA polymerase sigma factor (sigma-70 family)
MTMEQQSVPAGGTDDMIRATRAAGQLDLAATTLLQTYGPSILAFLASRSGSEDIAREIFANFSAAVWKALPRVQWRASVRSWAFAVARNELRAFMRTQRSWRDRHAPFTEADERMCPAFQAPTHDSHSLEHALSHLQRVLAPEDRALLQMRLRGHTWEEIAQHTIAVTPGTLGPALRRESARLRKRYQLLTRRLGALDVHAADAQ